MTVTSTTPFGGIKTEVVIRKYGFCSQQIGRKIAKARCALWMICGISSFILMTEYISKYISLMCQEKNFSEAKSQYDNSVAASAAVSDIASSKRRLAIIQKDVARRMADALRALETFSTRGGQGLRAKRVVYGGATTNALVRSFERARSAAIRGGQTMHRRSGGGDGRITNTLQGGAASRLSSMEV